MWRLPHFLGFVRAVASGFLVLLHHAFESDLCVQRADAASNHCRRHKAGTLQPRDLSKFIELSRLVAVIICHSSLLWRNVVLQGIEARISRFFYVKMDSARLSWTVFYASLVSDSHLSVSVSHEEYQKLQCSGLWLHENVFVFSGMLLEAIR